MQTPARAVLKLQDYLEIYQSFGLLVLGMPTAESKGDRDQLLSCRCCQFCLDKAKVDDSPHGSKSQHHLIPATLTDNLLCQTATRRTRYFTHFTVTHTHTVSHEIMRVSEAEGQITLCVCVCVINQASRECRCQRCASELRRRERPPDVIKALFTSLGLKPITMTQTANVRLWNVWTNKESTFSSFQSSQTLLSKGG